jgi:hypothetical protein
MERAKSPSVRAVVLTSYWSDFFQRNLLYRLGDDERNPIGLSEPVTDSIFANFERDISHLVASGKKVFVVLTIPIGGNSEFDPKSWLPGRLDANDKPRIIPDISLADYRRREEPVLRRVRISASRAGAVVLDPVRYMCSTTSCATIDAAGDPLYMDARHLRASVARTKAVWMDETLR